MILDGRPPSSPRTRQPSGKTSAAARALDTLDTARSGPTFGALAREWWSGVESGSVGKRKGHKGQGYSDTTLAGYKRSLSDTLLPEFEDEPATKLDEQRWQAWIDRDSRQGLSRSRLANHLAVVSAIYGWGSRPTVASRATQPDGRRRAATER